MQQHIEKVFEVIENMHYVEKGTYFKPADHSRGVSIHRIKTQIGDTEQMGAEEHFDFITANVLFYNYSEGFKVYQDNQWKRLQPPPHPMILFNLGSVLCMRSNQKIRALFHRVDTPSYAVGKPDRLAVLISVIPGLQEIIKPHSSFGPSIYKPHTFEEHILYGASMYTTLSEHVKYIPDGAKVIGVDIKKVQALGCLYSCLFRNPCFSLLGNNTSTIKNTNDSNSLPITNEPYVAFSRLNHEESFLIDFDGVRIIVNPCLSDEIPRKYAPVSVAAVSTRSIHGIIVSSPLPEYFDLLTLEEFNDDIPIYATNEVKILLDDYFSKRKSKKVIEINANGVVINNTVTIYNLSTTFGIKQSGILFSSSIKTLYLPNGLHVSQIQSFYDKLGTDCTFDLILLKASSSCSVRGIDRSFNLLDNSKVISKLKPRKVINLHSEMNLGTGLFVPPRSNEDVNIKDITKVESFEVIEVNDYNEQILFGAMSVKCNPKTRIYGK